MYFPTSSALIEFLILAVLEQGILMVMRLAKPLNSSPISKNLRSIPFSKIEASGFLTTYSREFQGVCANTTP